MSRDLDRESELENELQDLKDTLDVEDKENELLRSELFTAIDRIKELEARTMPDKEKIVEIIEHIGAHVSCLGESGIEETDYYIHENQFDELANKISQSFTLPEISVDEVAKINARFKPVNEDRIKEIINNEFDKVFLVVNGINLRGVTQQEKIENSAHAIAVGFAVSTCDHEPLDVDKLETFMQSLENMNYPRGAKEWAKEICTRFRAPGLSELTALKQHIDEIDE